jgi:RNA polymerase sigma factor (sigma-70 family)
MTNLPKKKFLRSAEDGEGPGVLTTLLRVYIEERDRSALDMFFELLYDDHFTDLALQVHNYGKASDVTVKEVIDESLAKLLEDVTLEKYRKAPESAAEHLKYLLLRRFIDRRRYWDRDHEDVVEHRETIVDKQAEIPDQTALERERDSIADERLERALLQLSAADQELLRLKLQGVSYNEIAQRLGVPESTLWKALKRALERLLSRLSESAPTMTHRLKDLKEKIAPATRPRWPALTEIREALPPITERVRTVLDRLHFQGVSRETLAAEFGVETLDVLLRRGYDILEARFKVSFPEAFERAKP